MNLFECKESMPVETSDFAVQAAQTSKDKWNSPNAGMVGERVDKSMSVHCAEPKKRGCHY